MSEADTNIVTPVQLAKELEIRPQLVFGWIRRGLIPHHKCVCNHTYLLRDEVSDYLEERQVKLDEKAAAEQAKVEAELQGAELFA